MPDEKTVSPTYTETAAAARAAAVRELSPGTPRALRLPAVEAVTGMKKTSIYDAVRRGEFPRPVALGARARGWLEPEVIEWINARAAMRA